MFKSTMKIKKLLDIQYAKSNAADKRNLDLSFFKSPIRIRSKYPDSDPKLLIEVSLNANQLIILDNFGSYNIMQYGYVQEVLSLFYRDLLY